MMLAPLRRGVLVSVFGHARYSLQRSAGAQPVLGPSLASCSSGLLISRTVCRLLHRV